MSTEGNPIQQFQSVQKEGNTISDVVDVSNEAMGGNNPHSEGDVGKAQEEMLNSIRESIYNEVEKAISSSDPQVIVGFLGKIKAEELQILTVDHFNKVLHVLAETENEELYWVLNDVVSKCNNALASLWSISAEKEMQVTKDDSLLKKLFWDTCSSDIPVSLNNTEVVNSVISIFSNPAVSLEFKTTISHAVINNSSDYPGVCERSVEFLAERGDLVSMPHSDAATYLDGLKYFNLLAYDEEVADYNEDYDFGFQNALPGLLKKKYEKIDLPYLIRLRLKKITDVSASEVHDDPYSDVDYNKYIMGSPEREEIVHRDKKYPFHLSGTLYALCKDNNDLVVVDTKGDRKFQQAMDISESKRLSFEAQHEVERTEEKAIFRFSKEYNMYPDTLYRALGEGGDVPAEIIEKIKISCEDVVKKSTKTEKTYLSKLFDFNQQFTGQSFADYFSEQFNPESNKNAHILKKADLSKFFGTNEISDEYWQDYRFVASSSVFEDMFEEFDVDVTCLSLREQLYFLDYLKNKKESEVEKFKEFCTTYGIKGARTFLSVERGGDGLGNKIVAFGEKGETAEKVFTYYGDLLDSAERAEELVKNMSDDGMYDRETVVSVRENLLSRAQIDLETAVTANNPNKVEALVKNYVAQAKEYVALLQEVGEGNIEQKTAHELTQNDQEQMLTLLQSNYEDTYKNEEDKEFKTVVQESLKSAFKNPHTIFRTLRDKGKIISFNRFDTLRDTEGKEVTYFGSFNANPTYSGVGGVMLEKSINERLQDGRPMMGHCDPTQSITKKYIESGFVATSLQDFAGKPSFEIWRTVNSVSEFATKTMTIEELLSGHQTEKTFTVREQQELETYPELEQGDVLTRYFVHDGKTYLVFEEGEGFEKMPVSSIA